MVKKKNRLFQHLAIHKMLMRAVSDENSDEEDDNTLIDDAYDFESDTDFWTTYDADVYRRHSHSNRKPDLNFYDEKYYPYERMPSFVPQGQHTLHNKKK